MIRRKGSRPRRCGGLTIPIPMKVPEGQEGFDIPELAWLWKKTGKQLCSKCFKTTRWDRA